MKKISTFFFSRIQDICYVFYSHLENFVLKKQKNFVLQLFQFLALFFLLRRWYKNPPRDALWSKSGFLTSMFGWLGLYFNTNNLGNPYSIKSSTLSITQKIEKQVIEWNKSLIHEESDDIEGYVTSGGTESNLLLMWMGREWLRKKNINVFPVVVISDFTHYSVRKAIRILGLSEERVFVERKNWGIDPKHYEQKLRLLINSGKTSVLSCVTLGYSSTGAVDPLEDMLKVIKKLQKEFAEFFCYIWVDAASQGLPLSLLARDFQPLKDSLVQGYLVDFHKFGGTPNPSGIVLYRKSLRSLIETEIEYLDESDVTISGSRPGMSALVIWQVMQNEEKMRRRLLKSVEKKKWFLKYLQKKYGKMITIIDTQFSLSSGIVVKNKGEEFFDKLKSEGLSKVWKIRYNGKNTIRHHKVHFQ